MDDEKSITEKLTDAISKAADSVKSVVGHVIETASDAAQHAMEANAEKIARIPPARADPEQVATTTNEQVYIPETSDAAAMPMPLFPVAPAKKKPTPNKAAATKAKPSRSGRITPAYDFPAPKSKMPAARKKQAAKKKAPAKKPATKLAKKAATKYAAKKTSKAAKKSSVRSSNKAKRKSKK